MQEVSGSCLLPENKRKTDIRLDVCYAVIYLDYWPPRNRAEIQCSELELATNWPLAEISGIEAAEGLRPQAAGADGSKCKRSAVLAYCLKVKEKQTSDWMSVTLAEISGIEAAEGLRPPAAGADGSKCKRSAVLACCLKAKEKQTSDWMSVTLVEISGIEPLTS